jgi:vitamin B12 transporter
MKSIRWTALRAVLLSCLLPVSSNFAQAEQTPEAASREPALSGTSAQAPIIITANRFPTSVEQIGSSVTVIDKDTIEKRGQSTVLELLRSVPGIEVVQIGGPGRTASVFIRGGDSDHTLVLVDGVRVNDNTTGQFDFANLKAENIERIEILRGPQSVLYGSEAIGGVIQIITARAKDGAHASVSAAGGSFGAQQYRSSLSWGNAGTYSSTTVSYERTDGISVATSRRGNPEDDFYDNISLSTSNGTTFLDDGKAMLSFGYSTSSTELDGFEFGTGAVDDPNATQDTDAITTAVSISKPITEWVSARLEAGLARQDLDGRDPDTEFNNFEIDTQSLSTTGLIDLFPQFLGGPTTLGYTHEAKDGENKGSFDRGRDVNSVFAQKQFSFEERLFLTAGIRQDHDSAFGEETTYRTTLAYLIASTGTRLHGSFGTGFKAPSLNELYFPNFGNPDLSPETSRGYDIGIEQSILKEEGSIDVTFFQNEVDDLITFDTTTFLAENIEEAKNYGIETSVFYLLHESLSTKFSYSYLHSENESTGMILARRPRHRGTMDFIYNPIESLDLALTFLLVHSRRDSDGAKMDDYERVDARAAYAITDYFKPFIRIENLFDEEYEEVPTYGTPGFSVYAGIETAL